MALVLKDRVKETTTTTGTGTLTLAGAMSGFQAFSVIGNTNTTYYAIYEPSGTAWEVGIGTYTLAGTTLSRDTILASSNAGAAVNFGAGTKVVFCTYPAGKSVYLDASGNAIGLGTPAAFVATNVTGLPISTGVSGLGTGVATALAVNTGTAGAFVVNGGALGTPLSGTVTNLTGTASININGTVGATTPNTGAFTTISATGVVTVSAGSVGAPAIISTTGTADTGQWFPAADTIAWSTAGSERMRIASNGNIGIGTTSSSYKLYVQSSAVSSLGGFTYTPQIVTEANATGGIGMNTPTGNQAIIAHSTPLDQTSASIHFDGLDRYMSFCTVADTERMRINNLGYLLINTTLPINSTYNSMLEILGTPYMQTWRYTSATAGRYWQWAIDSNSKLYLWDQSYTGVTINSGDTSWSAYSDIRVKETIQPLINGLDKIASLNPFIGRFKNDDPDKRRVMLSAQEVLDVLPEAVEKSKPMTDIYKEYIGDDDILSLRYTDVIPLLVAALKELHEKFVLLESKVQNI